MKKKIRKSVEEAPGSAVDSVGEEAFVDSEMNGVDVQQGAAAESADLGVSIRDKKRKKRRSRGEQEGGEACDIDHVEAEKSEKPPRHPGGKRPSATSATAAAAASPRSSSPGSPVSAPSSLAGASKRKKTAGDGLAPGAALSLPQRPPNQACAWKLGGGSLVHRAAVFLCGGKVLCAPRGEAFGCEATAGPLRKRELCFFSAETGRLLYVTHAHTDTITSVVALPLGASPHLPASLALSASLDGSLCLWEAPSQPLMSMASGYLLHELEVGVPILAAAYAPGTREVVLLVQGEARAAPVYAVYTLPLGALLAPPAKARLAPARAEAAPKFALMPAFLFSISHPPTAFCASASGNFVVVASGKRLLVFSRELGRLLLLRHVDRLVQVSVHPTDDFVVAGDRIGRILIFYCLNDVAAFLSAGLEVAAQEDAAEPLSPASRRLPAPLHLSSALQPASAGAAAASKRTAAASSPSSLSPLILHWHAHAVTSLAFSADGVVLLSGGEEGVLVLWHVRQAFQKQFLPRLGAPVLHIAAQARAADGADPRGSRDDERVAVSCADNSLKLIDLVHFQVSRVIQGLDIPLPAFSHAQAAGGDSTCFAALGFEAAVSAGLCAACQGAAKKASTDKAKNSETPAAERDAEAPEDDADESERETEGSDAEARQHAKGACSACGRGVAAAQDKSALSPSRLFRLWQASARVSSTSPRGVFLSPLLPLSPVRALGFARDRRLATPSFLRGAESSNARGGGKPRAEGAQGAALDSRSLLLFSAKASRLQIYDCESDKHVFHLPIRPQRMYTSRIDDAFSASRWKVCLAAADVCCSCLAVVESRDSPTAVGDVVSLRGAQRGRGAAAPRAPGACPARIEDAAVPDGKYHSITFWVFEGDEEKDGKCREEGKFVAKTRVDAFHVNEVTALQPHTREPRFFFTLSKDTYFKAWREVAPPGAAKRGSRAEASSSASFFACVLEGAYRGLAPLACSLSLDASLLAIAHGGSLITLWNPASFSLSHSLRVPPASTLRAIAGACAGGAEAVEESGGDADARQVCNKLGLLESPYGLFLVAGMTSCIVLYDLLTLNITWAKSFDCGVVDFLFVEPAGGARFAIALAKLSTAEGAEGPNGREGSGEGESCARPASALAPSHELCIFSLSHLPPADAPRSGTQMSKKNKKKNAKEAHAEGEEDQLPLLPLVAPLQDCGAFAAASDGEDADGAAGSGVFVHCVWQQERSSLGQSILAGCFLPSPSSASLASPGDTDEESSLILLNARFQLETVRVPAGAVAGVATPHVIVESGCPEQEEEEQTKQRKLQRLLQLETAKRQAAEEEERGEEMEAPASSDVAGLFCKAAARREKKREREAAWALASADTVGPAPGALLQRLLGQLGGDEEAAADGEAAGKRSLSAQVLAATRLGEEHDASARIKMKKKICAEQQIQRDREETEARLAKDEKERALKRVPKGLLASLASSAVEDAEESD
ncbi:WD domain, G-beta repeat-containing protein [Besnoitia besnoiti]|uniref:WD domain, G-beta repeat-containing protein n=1 Tax=Besnoitia besnoiti TaxID=94643 RepID=A0A2A9MD67_BESBE|nr:WD domain, G-beta repeat-containing protein [Besnoitia besnoiti]PFH35935.1 WD domain, G-beta repeat-containing protein [Besnoitia besnoiti]